MANPRQTKHIEKKAIIYAKSYLEGFHDTLSTHFGKELSEIEKEGYAWPYLALYGRELGKNLSIAVFCSEFDTFLFFVKPLGKKIVKLLNEIDNPNFGSDWSTKTPEKVKTEKVMDLLDLKPSDVIEQVHIGGTNRFLLLDASEVRRNAESHGRNKGEVLGETTIQFLPQLRGQAQHTATLLAFRKRYEMLKTKRLNRSDTKENIGHKFERLWREILDFYGWQPKKIILSGQGNDFTAIFEGNHILGEVRWEETPLDGEEIRDFSGKLEPRPQTIGLIISQSGFNQGAYDETKRLIAKKTVVFFSRDQVEAIIIKLVNPGEVFSKELRDVYDYLFEKEGNDKKDSKNKKRE